MPRRAPPTTNKLPEPPLDTGIYVTWLYSHTAKVPLIEIEIVEPKRRAKVQVTLAQAEGVVSMIMESREAALQDAFMLRFFRDKLDLGEEGAANLLIQLRRYRESLKEAEGHKSPMA